MSAARRLFCLLVVAVLNVAASENVEECSNITPAQGVTLNAMVGHWYFYRAVGPREIESNPSECITMNIELLNETTIYIDVPQSHMNFTLRATDPQKPWALFSARTGSVLMVVYISNDGNRLVQTFCRPNGQAKGYMLYTKDSPISEEELAGIERHIDEAGVIRTSDTEEFKTWQSTATCVAPV